MKAKSQSLFEESRLHLKDSIELSLESLREYGRRYRALGHGLLWRQRLQRYGDIHRLGHP
jgi:hypothetical protein